MKRGAPTWAPASRTHSSNNETTWYMYDDVKKHITVLSESLPANLFRNRTRTFSLEFADQFSCQFSCPRSCGKPSETRNGVPSNQIRCVSGPVRACVLSAVEIWV